MTPGGRIDGRLAFPWLTLAVAGAAAACQLSPRLAALCLYVRRPILEGELWRLWTGHLVHFSASHLAWDLAILLVAGGWLERRWPASARGYYAIAPAAIAAALLVFAPDLAFYGGLSGLGAGLLVLLAGRQLLAGDDAAGRGGWWLVLALLGLKLAAELAFGETMLVRAGSGLRNVPLAHWAGVATAGGFLLRARRPRRAGRGGGRDA